ncbi:variant erythrocyte surface antigen-1 family protein, partial [Babesia divergens]
RREERIKGGINLRGLEVIQSFKVIPTSLKKIIQVGGRRNFPRPLRPLRSIITPHPQDLEAVIKTRKHAQKNLCGLSLGAVRTAF